MTRQPVHPGLTAVRCNGKKCFETFEAAQRTARFVNRVQDDSTQEPYRCRDCRCFHLGNSDARRRRRAQANARRARTDEDTTP